MTHATQHIVANSDIHAIARYLEGIFLAMLLLIFTVIVK